MGVKSIEPIKIGSPESRVVLLKVLLRIRDQWNLTNVTLSKIIGCDKSQISKWEEAGKLPEKTDKNKMQMIGHFVSIYRSLSSIFYSTDDQIKWLSTKHPDLKSVPTDMMTCSIEECIFLRRYLDYVRGRGA